MAIERTVSDDGQTITYLVDVRLTGTATVTDKPCPNCGCGVLRSAGVLTLDHGSERPVVIERCVDLNCKPLTSENAASL